MSAGQNGIFDRVELRRLILDQMRLVRIGTWREAAANVLMIARSADLDERTAKVLSDAFDAYAAGLEADWKAARRPTARWADWIEKYLPGLSREKGKGSE